MDGWMEMLIQDDSLRGSPNRPFAVNGRLFCSLVQFSSVSHIGS